MFLRDGEEEAMRNTSCFVNLLLADNSLHFFKEASKSTPLFVH